MTRWYMDSSLALHALLPWGDVRAAEWMDACLAGGEAMFSSTLLELEVARALRRERLDPTLARPVLKRINLVSIDDGVLRVSAAIEPHVKSLDAIHLATCALLGTGIAVATHDEHMAQVAAQLGLDAWDPLLKRSRA